LLAHFAHSPPGITIAPRALPTRQAAPRGAGRAFEAPLEQPNSSSTAPPTFPESHPDLLQADVATFFTVGPDGCPQAIAVWLLYEDGALKLSLNTTRQKTRNLQRDPIVTLFILDRANPDRAHAEVAPDGGYVFADRVGQKYGGADLRQMDGPGQRRVVVTLHRSRSTRPRSAERAEPSLIIRAPRRIARAGGRLSTRQQERDETPHTRSQLGDRLIPF
jgi:PPOX class probable F420-dependent enzyme